MDFTLDLLIRKCDIGKLKLSESLVEWGGESFSQEPPKYTSDSELVFEQFLNLNYYKSYYSKIIGNDLETDNYMALRLLGTHIFDLELLINNDRVDLSNNKVMVFLYDLFILDAFSLFLIRDEECVDIRYRINTEKELHDIICNSLNRTDPKGVFIIKNSDGKL